MFNKANEEIQLYQGLTKNHSELVDKEELNLFLTSLVHLHYLLFSP